MKQILRIYDIGIANVDLSNHHDHVLAKNFDEAYRKGVKIVASYKKSGWKNAELVIVEFENEITEIELDKKQGVKD